MEPQPTTSNSRNWRLWHCTNYVIGGTTFLLGSILLFHFFSTFAILDAARVSAILYTFGSFCFCLADFTEWTHYESKVLCKEGSKCCVYSWISLNFFTSLTGSIIYLVGSACFLPQVNKATEGIYLFIIGSSFIMFSQTWKILRTVIEGHHNRAILKQIKKDLSGFFTDLFAGLGGLMYFTGSFIFFNPEPNYQTAAAAIYSFGGFFFYLSGVFMGKRYFFEHQTQSIKIAATQSKIESENLKEMQESNSDELS